MVQPLDVSQNPYKFGTPEYDAWMAEARKKQFENTAQPGTPEYDAFEVSKKVSGYMNPVGVDDDGKPVFSMPGFQVSKQVPDAFGNLVSRQYIEIPYVYADGNPVDPSKLSKNANAIATSLSGRSVSGLGADVTVDALPYQKLIDKVNKNIGQFASPGGDTYFDPETKMVVVRDSNGTSIYNEKGMLVSGRGSVNRVGVAKGSAGLGAQIDINGVGAFGTPDYNRSIANAAKQNLAYAGSDLQNQAFGSLGTAAAPFIVNGKPYTGVSGGRNYVNGIATGDTTTATGITGTSGDTTITGTTTSNITTNPYAPGSDAAKAWNERKSAYDLLYSEFNKYGLGTLVTPLKDLIQKGVSPSEFTIELRNSPQYQTRFAANAKRIQSGLSALNEAQYIGLEDQYQNIMRNYGLPEQYYARGDLGVQAGFEKFIANDVSPVELEDRIQTAERRVRYANPEVGIALKTFYPDITNGDVLAYALDPKTALESLKRRITAAEVGSTAVQMGLATNVTDAEYLARYGVTKQTAQQGYSTIAGGLQRGSQLASIYGEDPYTQTTAEREVFGVPGATEAKAARQKITGLEKATFGGQSGVSSSALARERAGGF